MSLPEKWIIELHSRLHVHYGDAWPRKWEGLDMEAVRRSWARELSDLTPPAIAHGLDNLPEAFPPTAGQFRSIALAGTPRTEGGMKMLPGPDLKADPARMGALVGKLREAVQQRPDARREYLASLEAREAAGTLSGPQKAQLQALRQVTYSAAPVMGSFAEIPKADWPWVKRGDAPYSRSAA